jgi:hypothetical protein
MGTNSKVSFHLKIPYALPVLCTLSGYFNDKKERSGAGIYIWSNGARYEGNWQNDKMNGEGRLKTSQDEKFQGNWEDNELVFKLKAIEKPLNENTANLVLKKGLSAMFKKK